MIIEQNGRNHHVGLTEGSKVAVIRVIINAGRHIHSRIILNASQPSLLINFRNERINPIIISKNICKTPIAVD